MITFLMITALTALSLSTGCSKPKEPEPIAGGSWKTNGPYNILSQNTPEGTVNIYAQVNDASNQVSLVEDADEFHLISACKLGEKIQDVDMIWNALSMEDMNEDGFDDFIVRDMFEDHIHCYVFLWDKDNAGFEEAPSEELSYDEDLPADGK